MAIINDLPGVEVTVTVHDYDLQEYHDGDVEDEERTVTKYIQAQEGQLFEVRIKVPKGFTFEGDCLAFTIFVDGNWVVEPLVDAELCALCDSLDRIKGVEEPNNYIRRFCFRAIELGKESLLRMK